MDSKEKIDNSLIVEKLIKETKSKEHYLVLQRNLVLNYISKCNSLVNEVKSSSKEAKLALLEKAYKIVQKLEKFVDTFK